VKTEHHFKLVEEYGAHDIWEDNWEYYADGVGLVKSQWHFYDEDNDPMGANYWNDGEILLKYVDTGPIPQLFLETEPNDSAFAETPRTISIPAIIIGNAALGDEGQIMSDTGVYADTLGVRIIQDWYRFSLPAYQTVSIKMGFEGTSNDLDLYLFQESPGPDLHYAARSINPQGKSEEISKGLDGGVWYVGVQAWNTPNGRSEYWIIIQ